MRPPRLTFLGAAGTVTGSRHLLDDGKSQVLLDCGLFQGAKDLRQRNWRDSPVPARELEAVVLSHAHIDHSGGLPRLTREGYRGPIFGTSGTVDLLHLMLPDCAHLQMEEARYANKKKFSRHRPALPLFDADDAARALDLVQPRAYGEEFEVADEITATYRPAGHILGAASVDLKVGHRGAQRLVFSGDVGRYDRVILHDPEPVPEADVLLLESTYGNRRHPEGEREQLARVVRESVARGGVLIIPAFAVGRTQELLYSLRELEDRGEIPTLPVHVDSPMAINATATYMRHPEDHDLDMAELMDELRCPLCTRHFHLARTPEQSKALNDLDQPAIIISASGMATGGRVLHHLRRRLPDRRNTVMLVGYQAGGTRGRSLQEGAKFLRMFGHDVPVKATVETLDGFSAHADQDELLRWLSGFRRAPRHTYLVHGEEEAATALQERLQQELGWKVDIAKDGQQVSLAD